MSEPTTRTPLMPTPTDSAVTAGPSGAIPPTAQRWIQFSGLAVLIAVVLIILQPFLVPIAWATILTVASWPAFRWLHTRLGGRTRLAAALMTLLMVVVVVGPTILVSRALALEVERTIADLKTWAQTASFAVPAWVGQIPWIGPTVVARIESLRADPSAVQRWALSQLGPWALNVASALGNVGRILANAGVALLTLFFLYLHGARIVGQIRRGARSAAGERVHGMIGPLGEAMRAVMYGMVFTALTQGALGLIGYWAAGFRSPVLLGALTMVLAFFPFGAPVVYVPAGLSLLAEGRLVAGVLLLAWGALVVSSSDNVIRSWFISGATQTPFLLVVFGVLGGVAAFGSLGLFIGPIAIALLLELWREWTGPDVR